MSKKKIDNREELREKKAEQEMNEAADTPQEENTEGTESAESTEKNELSEKYIRLAADFQNYKRRTENEKSEIFAYANEKIVKDILVVIDNFERALLSAEDSSDKALADGVKMIYKQLTDLLNKFDVKEIESQGADFDPNFHHAVLAEPSDEFESNKIIETFQKGYTLNGRVVRPSMVKVAE